MRRTQAHAALLARAALPPHLPAAAVWSRAMSTCPVEQTYHVSSSCMLLEVTRILPLTVWSVATSARRKSTPAQK